MRRLPFLVLAGGLLVLAAGCADRGQPTAPGLRPSASAGFAAAPAITVMMPDED